MVWQTSLSNGTFTEQRQSGFVAYRRTCYSGDEPTCSLAGSLSELPPFSLSELAKFLSGLLPPSGRAIRYAWLTDLVKVHQDSAVPMALFGCTPSCGLPRGSWSATTPSPCCSAAPPSRGLPMSVNLQCSSSGRRSIRSPCPWWCFYGGS